MSFLPPRGGATLREAGVGGGGRGRRRDQTQAWPRQPRKTPGAGGAELSSPPLGAWAWA